MTFNERVAICITRMTGTMWMAYVFAAVSLISLPAAIASKDLFVIVSWLSQSFLQLVLLPVILVGQGLIQDSHDKLHEHHVAHSAKLDAILEIINSDED